MMAGRSSARRGVLTLLRYTCVTGHLGVGLLVAQSVTVRAVTPDHSDDRTQYHVLPKDAAEAVVDIMRAVAVLPPLYGGHDDKDG